LARSRNYHYLGIVAKIPNEGWRAAAAVVLFPALLIAPIADDIIGGLQFRALCEEKTAIRVDESRAAGKTVSLIRDRSIQVPWSLVPAIEQPWRYADVDTQEVLVSFSTLDARGGWLIRALGVSETDSPITFSRSCGPADRSSVFQELNIRKVEDSIPRKPR
jgi:hypothetical protein